MGQVPVLHRFVGGNSFLRELAFGPHFMESMSQMFVIAQTQIKAFRDKVENGKIDPEQPITFSERLLTTQKLNPDLLTNRELDVHAFGNITAGGDTTSIALRAILYYVLKAPEAHKRLVSEIDHANISFPVSHESANSLPYFQACIREAMRMHPSVGLLLARTVPTGGATICGKFLPKGTDVGVNPAVVHFDKTLFPDPHAFKPERWLTTDAAQLAAMNRSYLTFGHGPHTCSGKHISLMEISKLIPALFGRYDMVLENPERKITVKNHWFMFQTGIIIKISRRSKKSELI
jgi:cytochrome P450